MHLKPNRSQSALVKTVPNRGAHASYTKYYFAYRHLITAMCDLISLIARFMGPTWGPSGADRTQEGPMLAP